MAKIRSFGTRIWVNGEPLGCWRDLSPTSREASIIDVTCQGSLDNSREFIGGMIDNGTIEVQGLYDYDDAGQAVLREGINTEVPVIVVFTDGSGYAFNATIQNYGETNPLDDAVEFSSSLKISGAVSEVAPVIYVTGTLTTDGTTTPDTSPLLFIASSYSRPAFASSDGEISLSYDSFWSLDFVAGPSQWTSTADVTTPDQVSILYPGAWHADDNPHGWKPTSPATGTPVVTSIMPT